MFYQSTQRLVFIFLIYLMFFFIKSALHLMHISFFKVTLYRLCGLGELDYAVFFSHFGNIWLKFLYINLLMNQMLREITPPNAAAHPVFFPCYKFPVPISMLSLNVCIMMHLVFKKCPHFYSLLVV